MPDQPLPVDPGIVCRAQLTTPVTITGEGFSPITLDIPDNPRTALPTVTLVRSLDLVGGASDGAEILYSDGWGETIASRNGELLTWTSQQIMSFTVQPSLVLDDAGTAGMLAEGIYDVRVTNPNTSESTSQGAIAVVDKPVLSSTSPGIVCLAEEARTVTLSGQTILEIEDTSAELTWDCTDGSAGCEASTSGAFSVTELRNCQTIAHPAIRSQFCSEADVELAQDGIPVGYPRVEVLNPETANCRSEEDTRLRVVPPPVIDAILAVEEDASNVQPGDGTIICVDESDRDVTIFGQDILVIDGANPTVTMTDSAAAEQTLTVVSTGGCSTLETQGHTVERCDQITVTIPTETVTEPYQPTITLTNPAPAGCGDSRSDLITIIPGPTLESATPALVCTEDGTRSLVLAGTSFLVLDGENPSVALDGTDFAIDSVDGCADISIANRTAELCTGITLTLAQDSLTEGDTEVVVSNPGAAGCSVTDTEILTVPPALTLLAAEPPTVCQSAAGTLDVTVTGTGFLRVDGVPFTVEVEGTAVTPTLDDADCTALTVDGLSVDACTAFTVNLDATQYAIGGVEFVVTNPSPSDCAETSSAIFEIVTPPSITTIEPSNICEGQAESVTLTGTNFAQNATVLIGSTAATSVTANNCDSDGVCTELVATWDVGAGLVPGDYDVTVSNGTGCESVVTNGITVDPSPLVFFVDPPVIFNGINTDATLFTTGLSALAQTVELIDSAGNRTEITSFDSPVRPNRIIATFPDDDPNNPGNPIPAGDYEVSVTSANGCESVLNGTVTITDSLTLALEMIDPPFASPSQPTAVTITATDPAPAGEVQFESTPRLYLNPTTGGGTEVATALRAVVFEDATTLTAVVPGGVPPGQYDLIAVNPGGAVGLLPAAVTVTANEPPIVEAVSPSSLDAGATSAAKILGTGFEATAANVVVDLECRDFVSGAPVSSGTVTVDAAAATELDVTVDGSTIPLGAVCIVTVTNSDGAAFRYSAVSFKNASASAATLSPWGVSTATMNEPRRALGLEAGRPTFRSRFLYAVGGDDGTPANTKTTVESIGVDAFGQLDDVGRWTYQRNDLSAAMIGGTATNAPRAFSGVTRIGRFIYMVGGSDGSNPVNTVLRAQVLDPLAGPEVLDLDAALGDGTIGLGEGLWYYKVAAIFPDTDPSNPGGESLPGEVLNVQLPQVTENIVLTLNWQQISGASGYRIYRTPVVDDTVDNLQLLAEVSGETTTSFRDEGGATDPATTPMPTSSTGVWHSVANLGTPREAPAAVAVPDPADSSRYFLYAVGGRDGTGELNTGEFAIVTLAADGSQTVGAWTPLTATLGTAVAELNGFVVTPRDTTVVSDGDATDTDTWVYFGCGDDGGGATGAVEAAEIGADGQIAAFSSPGSGVTPGRAGAASFSSGGVLFVLGGGGGVASSGNDKSKDIINASGGFSTGGWDALGGGALPAAEPRIYSGTTQESAFFYIAGGATSGTDAGVTDKILLTIQ